MIRVTGKITNYIISGENSPKKKHNVILNIYVYIY